MRPWHILLFLLAVMAGLSLIGTLIPEGGLLIGDMMTLRMPSPRDVIFHTDEEQVDIGDILALPTNPSDMHPISGVYPKAAVSKTGPFVNDTTHLRPLEERIALHYPDNDVRVLWPLFSKLRKARSRDHPLRIMHYGDSQLEGDRITSYVRNRLQTQFGGTGPGLIAVADIVPSFSVDRVISDNWKRYSVMGDREPGLQHERYGALSSFSRFTPIKPDSVPPDTVESEAWVTLKPLQRAYGKAQEYSHVKLYFGWHRSPLTIEVLSSGEVIGHEVIDPADRLFIREWDLPGTPQELTFIFRGKDSPDVHGISLESRTGVVMDNIAARGAAGYEFLRNDRALLNAMFNDLDVHLLILQYGGNTIPNLKDAGDAARYGQFLGAQLGRFKKLIPGVSIIVIGPSDMSIKEGERYVTRPLLEDVRDAMMRNTLAQGAVFWDMYEAMGGRNSMVSWVSAEPPLAATDHTHFSQLGARKIGELFYSALIADFATYSKAEHN